jgi:hypothetical protein
LSFLDVDQVLAEYQDWTDKTAWPRRSSGDEVHAAVEGQTPPDQKDGPVGRFCRAFRVGDAIARFELPYVQGSTEGRWTYSLGSVAEGAIEYDDGLKFHSHHDTDPARGQNNAFDLVRLHKGWTYEQMVEFVSSLPECSETKASDEFEDLGPLPAVTSEAIAINEAGTEKFHVYSAEEFSAGQPMGWIVRDVLPRAELAVIYGESGSGKSFLTLDLCAAIMRGVNWRDKKTTKGRVVYVCAEGAGGFKSRLRAYAAKNNIELRTLPAVIGDAPNMMEEKDAAALAAQILKYKWEDA